MNIMNAINRYYYRKGAPYGYQGHLTREIEYECLLGITSHYEFGFFCIRGSVT